MLYNETHTETKKFIHSDFSGHCHRPYQKLVIVSTKSVWASFT